MTIKNKTIDIECINELKSIFPEHLFDAHAHIYREQDLNLDHPSYALPKGFDVSIDYWNKHLSAQLGGARIAGGLFFPYPTPNCDIDSANNWLIEELKKYPQSRGLLLISPKSSISKIKKLLLNPQIVGFKPYYIYAEGRGVPAPAMDDFLPEWAWELADDQGLILLVHLVRQCALADKDNSQQIRANCLNYPNAKLILAHAGRGFHAANTVKGVKMLAGIQNVFFDNSAICESQALVAILNEFGPGKLMWGSDFPLSQMLARTVSLGDGFIWIDSSLVDWKNQTTCIPDSLGLESIRALKEAGDYFCLSKADYQNIFCDNIMTLLGMKKHQMDRSTKLYEYAKTIIPAGTQLLSKRPEMYLPNYWPAYFSKAKGCECWDLDGRHYYDMTSNGIGACLLGFADPDVSQAVIRRVQDGSMCTLNPPEEVELADKLCEIHPWAKQARFTRTGGETATVAVRIARATTKRSKVAVCGYHGWHDWYLAANLGDGDRLDGHLLPGLNPLGVPKELKGTTITFNYNNKQQFEELTKQYGDDLAAIVMEPARYNDPDDGFLEFVRDKAHECGALLIFDEITIGWRMNFGGIHLKFGVNPDMAIYAKTLGNGHPIGAIIGTTEAMQGAHLSFISSTYWTESVGPVAALVTLKKMEMLNVPEHVNYIGDSTVKLWNKYAARHGVDIDSGDGYSALAHFRFVHDQANKLKTIFTQLMIEKGILASTVIYPTLAHNDDVLEVYKHALDDVFGKIADIISDGSISEFIKGPEAHTGFARLTN